jgi:predicted MPP superfamily phosphohydrolase
MSSRTARRSANYPHEITFLSTLDEEDVDTFPNEVENLHHPSPPPRPEFKTIFGIRVRTIALGLLGFGVVGAVVYGSLELVSNLRGGSEEYTVKPTLRFRKVNDEYKFKIVQLADIHLGEAPGSLWGPEQDKKTWSLIDSVLKKEKPDLIVLSGDQLSAENVRDNAIEYYKEMGERLTKYGIPWALVFGSHDDTNYVFNNTSFPAKYDRNDLVQIDMQFPLSLTQRGPPELFGVTNYILDIHVEDDPAAMIYMFDSGGGSLPSQLQQNQVSYFYMSEQRYPAVAFQHYPTRQLKYNDQQCLGFHGEAVDTLHYDPGIVDAMSESTRVAFLGVGHDHGNQYCCPFSTWMQACFGGHSGYGGYGSWDRGARVYELLMNDPAERKLDWRSWVRLENGESADSVSMEKMIEMKNLN